MEDCVDIPDINLLSGQRAKDLLRMAQGAGMRFDAVDLDVFVLICDAG
jgi:hypothetical protein